MEERLRRPACPACRYPTVRLEDFDGTWSGDAIQREEANPAAFLRFGWGGLVFHLLRSLFKFAGKESRRNKIQRLREEVLPDFPDSLICPDCLEVIRRRQ